MRGQAWRVLAVTGGLFVPAVLGAGCRDRAQPPHVYNLSLVPIPAAPGSARLTLATTEPTRITVGVDDGQRFLTLKSGDDFAREHTFEVAGLRPATTHTVTLSAVTRDGRKTVMDPRAYTTRRSPPAGSRAATAALEDGGHDGQEHDDEVVEEPDRAEKGFGQQIDRREQIQTG